MSATEQQLKNQLQAVSAELAAIDKASIGQGTYGGVDITTSKSEHDKEFVRSRCLFYGRQQKKLKEQLNQLGSSQPAQAPPRLEDGSGQGHFHSQRQERFRGYFYFPTTFDLSACRTYKDAGCAGFLNRMPCDFKHYHIEK